MKHAMRAIANKWNKRVVLHFVTSAAVSIAQSRMVAALAHGLADRYDLHCCFVDGRGPLRTELEEVGVPTYDLMSDNLHTPRAAVLFHRLLCAIRPAILHDHYCGPISRVIATLAGVPAILLHTHSRLPSQQRWRPWTRSPIFADRVIASSKAVAGCIGQRSTTVVYPGVSVSRMTHDSEFTNVIGTIGRLSKEKGTKCLIRAMGLLRDSIPELRLQVIGTGPQRQELEELVSAMDLSSRVEFVGWQSDITKYVRHWDLCVLPSLEEGFGVAAVEAMASGVPVVASCVGGLKEVIVDEKTGWLVEPGEPEVLAKQIRSVLCDSSLRSQVAESGRQFALEHFSTAAMVGKIRAIYDAI